VFLFICIIVGTGTRQVVVVVRDGIHDQAETDHCGQPDGGE
jgi:hypothetical protein